MQSSARLVPQTAESEGEGARVPEEPTEAESAKSSAPETEAAVGKRAKEVGAAAWEVHPKPWILQTAVFHFFVVQTAPPERHLRSQGVTICSSMEWQGPAK